jgi:hypothetical protein
MKRRTVFVLAVSAAVGVAVAAAVVLATRDGSAPVAHPVGETSRATPVSNQIRLSHAESLRLVGWAARFRACMAGRGVALAQPVPHEQEIDLPVRSGPKGRALAREVVACGDALGEPPRSSSLQLRGRGLVLYLPKQCLLDKAVVGGTTTSS